MKKIGNKIKGVEVKSSWIGDPLVGVILEKPLPDDFEPILIKGVKHEKEEVDKGSGVETTEGIH